MSLLTAEELEAYRVAPESTYAELKASSESRAARWVWATGPFYSLQPFDAERGGWPRGRICTKTPDDVSKKYQFGLDENDRLWVIREHTEFEGCCNETFVDARNQEWVWRYTHRDHDVPHVVMQRVYENDRLVSTARKSQFGHTVEHYDWRDGRIRTITVHYDTGDTNQYEIKYEGGLLSEVSIVRDGAPDHVVYAAKSRDLRALLSAMEARLPEVVHRRVVNANEDRTVFCLALSYSEESAEEMALPALSLGLESDRERWRSSDLSPSDLWNPAGFSTHGSDALELDDAELGELARAITLILRAPKDFAAVKNSYLRSAQALAAMEWQTAITTTDDFKVLAVDVEMSDLKSNFKAIIGAGPTKEMQREGLL